MLAVIKRNPWPCAIIGYFVVFITAMAGWITFAFRNEMELVRSDYYEQEILYQNQIDRIARTDSSRTRVTYTPAQKSVTIFLPPEHTTAEATGELHFYRPSDSKLDRRIPLALSTSGLQTIDVADFKPGFWKLKISWSAHGEEFYFAQPLVLTGP